MSNQYAVIGNPIAHSLSPEIHNLFARQTNQDMYYTRLLATPQNFSYVVRQFQRHGGKGLNVTSPFKKLAFNIAHHNSQRANLAQAVNTLLISPDGSMIGDNTDGVGLIRDLVKEKAFHPHKKHILIIGVGGAVSGILEELLRREPASITFATRTLDKAISLIRQFQHLGELTTCQLSDSIDISRYQLLINATPVDWQAEPLLQVTEHALRHTACYDLNYSLSETSFLAWAKQQGCTHRRDGLGMLVEQAAESFYLWHGIRPETNQALELLIQAHKKSA